MSEAQKRGKLNEVKKEAMKDSAKSMGKTEKEAEALMNDKSGSKYQGDNIFEAMISIGKDRFNKLINPVECAKDHNHSCCDKRHNNHRNTRNKIDNSPRLFGKQMPASYVK
jgi:hypothetical protein